MGILMGLFMAVAVAIVVVTLTKTSEVLPGNASLIVLIPIVAGTYTALLGVLGALMGSRSNSGVKLSSSRALRPWEDKD